MDRARLTAICAISAPMSWLCSTSTAASARPTTANVAATTPPARRRAAAAASVSIPPPPTKIRSGSGSSIRHPGAVPSITVTARPRALLRIRSQSSGFLSTANTRRPGARRAASTETLPLPAPRSHMVADPCNWSLERAAARTSLLVIMPSRWANSPSGRPQAITASGAIGCPSTVNTSTDKGSKEPPARPARSVRTTDSSDSPRRLITHAWR